VAWPKSWCHLDRRGAVAGGEVIPVREAGGVAGAADDGGGGDDRADAEAFGAGGVRLIGDASTVLRRNSR
jgi:hypothetical protein